MDDKTPLATTSTVHPVLLFLPAMGVPVGFYEPFLRDLASACGGTVVPIELPGQGAHPLRASAGHDWGYREVVEELVPQALQRVGCEHPGRPVLLVGHSLGGQLAVLASASARIDGLVLIAAGTAHWRTWPRAQRWRAALAVHAIRVVARILPWYPGARLGFGGNQARRFMRDWSFNAASGRYRLEGSTRSSEDLVHSLRQRVLPLLAISLHGDPVAPAGALDELLSHLPRARVRREVLPGVRSDAPWRRHFSWARRPAGVHLPIARWLDEALRPA